MEHGTHVGSGSENASRLEALHRTGLLDTPSEPAFDRLTKLASRMLQAPVALVSLVDTDRQFFKSAQGLSEPLATRRETPLSHSFCHHVTSAGQPLVIPDAREHPLVRDNPAIRDLGVSAYLGVPIHTPDGHPIGTICAIDHQPHQWSDQDLEILQDLAAIGSSEIARLQLAREREALLEKEAERLRFVARATNDAAMDWDLRSDQIIWNEGLGTTFGYSSEGLEIPASWWKERIHPEDRASVLPSLEQAIAGTAERWSGEYRFLRASGDLAHVLDRAFIFRNEKGEAVRIIGSLLDRTPYKRIEEALRESEERHRLIVESALDYAIFTTDVEGRIDSWSPGAAAVFGWAAEEIIGQPAALTFVPEDRAEGAAEKERATAREKGVAPDVRWHQCKDGSRVFMNGSTRALRGPDGTLCGFLKIGQDITATKEAEEALRESNTRFEAVANLVPDLLWISDPAGKGTWYNRRWCEYTGQNLEEALGSGWAEAIHPEDREELRERFHATSATGRTFVHQQRIRGKDETYRWFLMRAEPRRDEAGRIVQWFGAVTDIHEQRLAMEELKETQELVTRLLGQSLHRMDTLMQSAPLPIIAYNREGEITLWNPAAEQTLGFAKEEVVGRLPPYILPEQIDEFHALRERLLKGERLQGLDRRLRRKDGTEIDVNLWASSLRDEEGQIIGSFTILKDVTQERATEAQLRQAQKMEAVGQLTGGIAHDFNNLLGIILGNAELMAEDPALVPRLRETAELMADTAERGSKLTHQLLAFARKQDLAPEPLDINEVITNLTTLLSRSLGEQMEIRTELEPNLPKALIDHAELESALVNLAVNARDAMPKGGRLILETKAVQVDREVFGDRLAPGTYIRVAVTDTGTGMPPEVVAQVFEPFFTTKEVGKGSGLGLAMVYGFVKQSGGHVDVYSEPGLGTTITLYLPVAEKPPAQAESDGDEALPKSSSETILLVEDEAAFRHFTATVLQKLGYEVVTCTDGPSALAELAKGLTPDLLLTDVILPGGINGREIAERIHQCHPDVPVLFMSGYPASVLSDRGTLSPQVRLLRKPFRKAQLAQAVYEALEAGSS